MKYFDLHCDTLYRALVENKSLRKNDFHISFEKGSEFKPWIQCFAVWIPDEKRDKDAVDLVNNAQSILINEINKYNKKVKLCKNKNDLESVIQKENIGAIFTVEGSAALGNDLSNLDKFKEMGVKVITLTWNGDCEFGSGIGSEIDLGITGFGKKVLRKMKKLNIIPDVSHSSKKLFFDLADIYNEPIIATHSNSKTVCKNKRNLTDEQFNIIKNKNGIVGLNFCKAFLNDSEDKASIEDVLRHAEQFLSLDGENVLCIGGDFDGTDIPADMVGIESVYDVAECFLKHNYKENTVNKILFDNAYNFFIKCYD